MNTLTVRDLMAAGLVCLLLAGNAFATSGPSTGAGDAVDLSTPPGITLVDVTSSAQKFLWRRLGDPSGKPLYTFDQDGAGGTATCVDECAKEFPPLIADRNAIAFDVWTLVTR